MRSVTVARFRRTCAAASAMMAREKIPESMPWLRHPHTPSATPNACGRRRCKKECKGWEKERKKELDNEYSDVSTQLTNTPTRQLQHTITKTNPTHISLQANTLYNRQQEAHLVTHFTRVQRTYLELPPPFHNIAAVGVVVLRVVVAGV